MKQAVATLIDRDTVEAMWCLAEYEPLLAGERPEDCLQVGR
jgi:hypothetical protein